MNRFLTIILLCFVSSVGAQLEITTSNLEEATWNEKDTSWNIYFSEGVTTFFDFNKELTELKQVSISRTLNYCILKWDYSESELKYTMKVVNNAGDEFELVIDGAKRYVLFFYWKKEKYFMNRYEIKSSEFKK